MSYNIGLYIFYMTWQVFEKLDFHLPFNLKKSYRYQRRKCCGMEGEKVVAHDRQPTPLAIDDASNIAILSLFILSLLRESKRGFAKF